MLNGPLRLAGKQTNQSSKRTTRWQLRIGGSRQTLWRSSLVLKLAKPKILRQKETKQNTQQQQKRLHQHGGEEEEKDPDTNSKS